MSWNKLFFPLQIWILNFYEQDQYFDGEQLNINVSFINRIAWHEF